MASSDNAVLDRLNTLESEVKQILAILKGGGGQSSSTGQASGGGQSSSATVTSADWQSLGAKLDQLEQTLSPKEKAVLMTVLGAAAATYARAGLQESPAGQSSMLKVTGNLASAKLSDGLKSIGSFQTGGISGFGGSPVEDSVGVGGDFTSVHADWSKDVKGSVLDDSMVRGQWNALAAAGGLVSNPVSQAGAFGRSGLGGGGFG